MSVGEPDRLPSSRRRPDFHLRRTRSGRAALIDRSLDRSLDRSIEVLPGTDVESAWDRFEVFEALHHSTQICNPMSEEQLDEAVAAVGVRDGHQVLDVACGYGEFLFRCGDQAAIAGTGVDLSPWMITTAARLAETRAPGSDFNWVLGEGRSYQPKQPPDVAICVGAEWVWHDFNGTARALSKMLADGGVAVIGAARLHLDADASQVRTKRGHVDTVDDMRVMLGAHGLEPTHRIDPDDAGWDEYLARTREAARDWQRVHPGARAEKWLDEQADWQQARERDRDVIGWSLWVAQKRSAGA